MRVVEEFPAKRSAGSGRDRDPRFDEYAALLMAGKVLVFTPEDIGDRDIKSFRASFRQALHLRGIALTMRHVDGDLYVKAAPPKA